ncbi:hypothetical protein Tco_1428071 [Tanacetum coccineum]
MLFPNLSSSYNGRPSFETPKYLKKAQSKKPCLYKIPYDKDDLANIFAPNQEETLTLEQESRSKLHKEIVKKQDYNYQNSLYENFTPQTQESLDHLYYANGSQNKMWRKSFVKYKLNIAKNIGFLPTQASLSKSRQAFSAIKHNINQFKTIVDLDWKKQMVNQWQQPITQEITVTVKNLLIALSINSRENANEFENVLKQEMFEDLEYVQSLKKEVDELESEKAKFSNEYDPLLQECVFKDIMCSILRYFESLDEKTELECLTKKPKVVPISTSKPKRNANQSNATPYKKIVASESTIQKSKSYFRMLYENTSKTWTWWIEKQCQSGYQCMLKTIKKWVPKVRRDVLSTSISSTTDITSRITNDSSPINDLGSNLSNAPLSSNSLADCSNHPICNSPKLGRSGIWVRGWYFIDQ